MRSAQPDRFEDDGSPRRPFEEQSEGPSRPRLLLVDDNVSVRESLSLLLRMDGFDVVEARDAFEALARLDEHGPDLIVTDLQMPGMHGADFIRKVRETSPSGDGARIIAISVHGPDALEAARAAGADAWVDKLADVDELLSAARGLLARR